jgi:hypothetical protein
MSAEETAREQQRDIGKAFREIADVRTEVAGVRGDVQKLQTALVGIDGTNGLRGELREFMLQQEKQMEEQDDMLREIITKQVEQQHWKENMEVKFTNYLNFERVATCHGKSALDVYLSKLETESIELRKQRMLGIFAIVSSIITVGGGIIIAVLRAGGN